MAALDPFDVLVGMGKIRRKELEEADLVDSARGTSTRLARLVAVGVDKEKLLGALSELTRMPVASPEKLAAAGPMNLPASFATFAAYGDFATGLLAMLALLTVRVRPLFWLFVTGFNVVGAVDIIVDYYHGNQVGLAALAGELGSTYAIPIIYVPLLMITHVAAFYLLLRPRLEATHVGSVSA